MPRFPRDYIKTNYFHVMIQGINKIYIFNNVEDIKYYIKIMYKLKEEHNIKIIAYCIMNNHAHLLIESQNIDNLSKYMQRLNTRYGKFYNKKYNRVGYVFRDRYKSEGIYDEKHLYNCIKYIYDNPVKAGICEKPENYPYSNYKSIPQLFIKEKYSFLDVEEEKEQNYKNFISVFIKENNMKISDLKKDKKNLKKLIKILNQEYKISLRQIAEEINIGRETIRKINND